MEQTSEKVGAVTASPKPGFSWRSLVIRGVNTVLLRLLGFIDIFNKKLQKAQHFSCEKKLVELYVVPYRSILAIKVVIYEANSNFMIMIKLTFQI